MSTYDGYEAEIYPAPTPIGAHVRSDIEAMLQLAIEMVQGAKTMPLSSSVLMNRDDLLEILETAVAQIPMEIKEARWALRDREELMATEIRKAEQLMDRVRAEAARMVDKTEIVRNARVAADRIVAESEERARTIINEAEDYCDQKLGGMEIVLDRLMKTVHSGRERLRPQVQAPAPEPFDTVDHYDDAHHVAPTHAEEGSFFDQDLG